MNKLYQLECLFQVMILSHDATQTLFSYTFKSKDKKFKEKMKINLPFFFKIKKKIKLTGA